MKKKQSTGPLRAWRSARSITWAAAQLGVARGTYYRLEESGGDIAISIVARIHSVTGIEYDTLSRWFGTKGDS